MVKDIKEKDTELKGITNEIQSKMKVVNQLNQQLPLKEARNKELDDLIKEKETQLKILNDKISNASIANQKE